MTSGWKAGLTITLDPGGTPTTLTDNMVGLPMYTDVGTEELNQAILILAAPKGKFITIAPIIEKLDLIRIAHTDEFGKVYNHVYEVDKRIPRQSKREGDKLELVLRGHEHNVGKVEYFKPHFFAGAKSVSVDILKNYNKDIGSDQPLITDFEGSANELPFWTVQNYEFGLNEEFGFDRMNEVVDKLGASPDAGGVFDFFEFRWDSDASDEKLIHFVAFSSGSQPPSPITIQQATTVNIGETEGGLEPEKATIVAVWGSVDDGSNPTDWSRYKGEKEAFDLHPQWLTDAPYQVNHRVKDVGIHYICTVDRTVGPNSPPAVDTASWDVITEAGEFGDVITYSPWTRQKSGLIRNSGCNHGDLGGTDTEPFGESFFDGNIVVWDDNEDDETFRTWVHVRTNTQAAIPTEYLYNNTSPDGSYRGLRVIPDPEVGVLGVPFTQNGGFDENNLEFRNAVVQHNGGTETGSNEYKNWNVLYEFNTSDQDDVMCLVKDEGRVYHYDFFAVPDKWVNIAGNAFANDCVHPYTSCVDDGGILATSLSDTPFTANTQSAVKITYEWSGIPLIFADIGANVQNYYQAGSWFNFTFPFPETDFRGIGENVGDIYGGGTQGTIVKEPATFDTQNMHFSHLGNRGFNITSPENADYGQCNALEFNIKFIPEFQFGGIGPFFQSLLANFKFRCLFGDTADNVVFSDFVVPHRGIWDSPKLPLGGFQIYRGRKPFQSQLSKVIPPKQLDPQNVFLWRNLKWMVIQYQDAYDDDGRYKPEGSPINGLGLGNFRTTLWIDSLRFTKPLLAVTDPVTVRYFMEPPAEQPLITNYRQLRNDAKFRLEKSKFQRKQYDVVTSGTYDIKFGESFFLNNSEMVSDADSGANTIKLVAKRIEYSITKPKGGSGGFLRTIQGVRRLET